jgi:hypothetical protein
MPGAFRMASSAPQAGAPHAAPTAAGPVHGPFLANTTGGFNTFLGFCAGFSNTTGVNNTMIGCGAAGLSGACSNMITLGNSSITQIRAQVTTITALSDARDKCDITTLNSGMDFLRQVRPVHFTWNMRDGGKVGVKETGFIAQELREVLDASEIKPWLADLVISNDDDSRLEATPGKLLPLMVRAIQELQEQVDALKAEVETLKSR